MSVERLIKTGLAFSVSGLVVQLLTSWVWTPGTFLGFALLGVPLVCLGSGMVALGVWRQPR
jgi:hypothetical protein